MEAVVVYLIVGTAGIWLCQKFWVNLRALSSGKVPGGSRPAPPRVAAVFESPRGLAFT